MTTASHTNRQTTRIIDPVDALDWIAINNELDAYGTQHHRRPTRDRVWAEKSSRGAC